jgi:hypothetical protein
MTCVNRGAALLMSLRPRFSLRALFALTTLAAIGLVCLSVHLERERRHTRAADHLFELGGHISYGKDARIVYFWKGAGFAEYEYVSDLEAAIRCLRQLRDFTHIVLVSGQAHMARELRRVFPGADIQFGRAGII